MNSPRNLPEEIVRAIASVVGYGPVALYEPRFRGNEWTCLKECLDSTFVSLVGRFVDRFEDGLAAYTGAILNGDVHIGAGGFVGSGSVIKEGITLGKSCIVGIYLSVRLNHADHTRFVGNDKL